MKYTEQSKKLAEQLAEKAASNLRKSGRNVSRDSTGRYIVAPLHPERRQKLRESTKD